MTWLAYADESMSGSARAYIIAAAVMSNDDCADARAALATLGGLRTRFHWRDAGTADRDKAVGVVAGLPALHLVVVGTRLDPRRQERARRHCLRRLLHELDQAGVQRLWLESRTPRQNRQDIQAIDAFRTAGVLSSLHVDHALPTAEPLLWAPDIVAGAVNLALRGDDVHEVVLRSLISRYDVAL